MHSHTKFKENEFLHYHPRSLQEPNSFKKFFFLMKSAICNIWLLTLNGNERKYNKLYLFSNYLLMSRRLSIKKEFSVEKCSIEDDK